MTSLNGVRRLRLTAKETLIASCEVFNTVEPRFTDTRWMWTSHYQGQFAPSLGKESPYISSKFNLLNTDTPLIRILSMAPSVSVLTEFDCTWKGNKLPQSRYWRRTRSYLLEEILEAWFPLMMDRHPGKLQLLLEKMSYFVWKVSRI